MVIRDIPNQASQQ